MASLPPRKALSVSACKPSPNRTGCLSPLQTLLQMGCPKHRAEKALAATGYRSAQLAADWLLAHVNDCTLDDTQGREYILYLCPTGSLSVQLHRFQSRYLQEFGWNNCVNHLPHIPLCSFFQCPDDCVTLLLNAFDRIVEKFRHQLPSKIQLEIGKSDHYYGLFLNEDQNNLFKRLSMAFMKEVSQFAGAESNPLHVIGTCFPWWSHFPSLSSQQRPRAVEVEPYSKSLHMTIAQQYDDKQRDTIDKLLEEIDLEADSLWELRLYSRDTRIQSNDVYKVLYTHVPQQVDELELLVGDFVYINSGNLLASPDGWAEGTSWLTGCTGMLPINFIERTAESDAWTLMRSAVVSGQEPVPDPGNTDTYVGEPLIPSEDMHSSTNCLLSQDQTEPEPKVLDHPLATEEVKITVKPRKLIIVRHAERVDFTFRDWISNCFDEKGKYRRNDLNQPLCVPKRDNPQEFAKDSPLTTIGQHVARLTGEGLKESGVTFTAVYCSPSYRCVQTCHEILSAMGIQNDLQINIEPGLFEWLAWYSDGLPNFLSFEHLQSLGFNVNLKYVPIISTEELAIKGTESMSQYYKRSHFLTTTIIEKTKGNILFVGHSATLEVCSRQLVGKEPRSEHGLCHVVRQIPYCGVVTVEQNSDSSKWSLVKPPIFTLQHTYNQKFDWKTTLCSD